MPHLRSHGPSPELSLPSRSDSRDFSEGSMSEVFNQIDARKVVWKPPVMLGAESSRAAGKRRRGPIPRPRGEPSSPVQFQGDERTIRYLEHERVPIIKTRRLRDHTLLMFEMGTFESDRLDMFISLELLHHWNISWDLIDQLGQRDRLERLLGPKWVRVLACDWPQYKELTMEFHSTFMYDDSEFDSLDAVSFSLGRQVYEMSILQFAVVSGFYTEDEVLSPMFGSSLRGATKKNRDFCLFEVDLSEFWATIADSPFSTSMLESDIRDPLLRYIHRVLECTLVGLGRRRSTGLTFSVYTAWSQGERPMWPVY
ncbi:hypothetical protein R6Q57_020629 [Mikania cordata]